MPIFALLMPVLLLVLPAQQAAPKPAVPAKPADPNAPFFLHHVHVGELSLDCSTCHTTEGPTSVKMKRPGHDQCMACHSDAFEKPSSTPSAVKICAQCHSESKPSATDLKPFPLYKKQRAILIDFAHARHVDPKARLNPKTGFRADCTFCHKFQSDGVFATFPGHAECAGCHAKDGALPHLTPASDTKDCRGCHSPEEIENPGFTKTRKFADHVVSGVHVNIKFSHIAHFKAKERENLNCTTCHYSIPTSTSLADLNLPKMIDCVQCHDVSKEMPAQFQMTNCQTCHIDARTGNAPGSHTRNVKPAFHNESFRTHHEAEASAPGAKCFVCHVAVKAPSAATLSSDTPGSKQCIGCHQVMRPASHTARWADDVHGQMAALDRRQCALCHSAETCQDCHSQTPRSHFPLATFVNGGHAMLARLDQRACMTCHTYADTCQKCHVR